MLFVTLFEHWLALCNVIIVRVLIVNFSLEVATVKKEYIIGDLWLSVEPHLCKRSENNRTWKKAWSARWPNEDKPIRIEQALCVRILSQWKWNPITIIKTLRQADYDKTGASHICNKGSTVQPVSPPKAASSTLLRKPRPQEPQGGVT